MAGYGWRRSPVKRGIGLAMLMMAMTGLAACVDRAAPPLEVQIQSLGAPIESMLTVNEDTKATVHLRDGKPELVIFRPFAFGGWEPHAFPADVPTVNGGAFGNGASTGPGSAPTYVYVFGAGQGPLSAVRIAAAEATSKIVNPEINGWVIVYPDGTDFRQTGWELVGLDGKVLFSRGRLPRPSPSPS